MFKKPLTVLLSAVLLAQPMTSHASLSDAFTSLTKGATTAVNKPGRYESGARNSFSGGGFELRAPRQSSNPQLFSFTPPRISAGCGGISATFGGFSFISGEEFEQMLKSLASGAALGFVSMIAIKALCPQCEAVIQFLKTAAQQAARLSKDACRWGQQMGAEFMSSMGFSGGGETSRNYCTASNMAANKKGDAMSLADTIGGYCYQMKDAVDNLLNTAKKSDDPNELAELACSIGAGNVTWSRLQVFESGTDKEAQARRLLWMNLLGAELNYIGEKSGEDGKKTQQAYCETPGSGMIEPKAEDGNAKPATCPPRLQPIDAMYLFMCGKPGTDGVPSGLTPDDAKSAIYGSVVDYCKKGYEQIKKSDSAVKDLASLKVYYCDGKADAKFENCNAVKLGDVDHIVTGDGYMVHVMKSLKAGVDAVRTNTAMPEDTIKLVQVAPFPLYQAINAAAVYPSAAADLLGGVGAMIAEQLALGHLDEMLRMAGRATSEKNVGCLSAGQASQLLSAMAESRATTREVTKRLGQNMAAQEQITAQIRQINLAIQKQVMSSEMLTSNIYSQGVTGKLKAVLPSTPAAAPAGK